MIKITNKEKCCGCEACKNICPQKCINMIEDNEGFRYPNIDESKCLNCNLCEKVCPLLNEPVKSDILNNVKFLAAYNKDEDILSKSSSGGIFWILAQCILKNQGVIYGVVQDKIDDIKFIRTDNKEECEKIRGSKYLQANINDIYIKVKKDLDEEKKVLFSGTPCQVAALYKFLDKDYKNLYTVDVVCHGVPSEKVFRQYIRYMETIHKKKVINIKWRNKKGGWSPNKITLFFQDGSTYTTISRDNPFQVGFLENIYLRPSCYECKYARLPRIGDVSLADFWGYDGNLLEENKNRGLSIIIISSYKGAELIENNIENINYHYVDEEYVKSKSRHVYTHPLKNEKREQFFYDLENMSFAKISKKYKMKDNLIIISLKKLKRKIIK